MQHFAHKGVNFIFILSLLSGFILNTLHVKYTPQTYMCTSLKHGRRKNRETDGEETKHKTTLKNILAVFLLNNL